MALVYKTVKSSHLPDDMEQDANERRRGVPSPRRYGARRERAKARVRSADGAPKRVSIKLKCFSTNTLDTV
jgi:hypothetical protein